ncbi:hypothetical protein TEA_012960 [Camellia sinensis var. sinensis]|uniref:Uncharacterized protein n=1 Tax=Camellia sinensis var. sinensis TaxID=542762 RepID=A0A4S4F3A9_CAMSN|nr:hypothetical protein TEA_012960 [Camellia sinensis var. sinensis]
MEEETNKPAQTTPPPTQIPVPNTPQNLPPQPPPSTEQPQPPQTSQNPDPNTTQNPPNTNPPNPSQNLTPQPMEESETAQTTLPTQNPIPNPPNITQNLPPPHLPPLPQKNNKRPLDQNGHIQNSKYFKMRAVLKDLRPHFIEVLRTPVFHNCKAAHEIRERPVIIVPSLLHHKVKEPCLPCVVQIVGYEAHILLKGSCACIVPVLDTNAPQIFAGTYPILDEMKLLMDLYKEMTAETISTDKFKNVPEGPLSGEIQYGQKHNHQYAKPTEQPSAPVLLGTISDKQTQGTYIVGGSAFGWNFVTYPGFMFWKVLRLKRPNTEGNPGARPSKGLPTGGILHTGFTPTLQALDMVKDPLPPMVVDCCEVISDGKSEEKKLEREIVLGSFWSFESGLTAFVWCSITLFV